MEIPHICTSGQHALKYDSLSTLMKRRKAKTHIANLFHLRVCWTKRGPTWVNTEHKSHPNMNGLSGGQQWFTTFKVLKKTQSKHNWMVTEKRITNMRHLHCLSIIYPRHSMSVIYAYIDPPGTTPTDRHICVWVLHFFRAPQMVVLFRWAVFSRSR